MAKILFVNPHAPPKGGAAQVTWDLAANWRSTDAITIVTCEKGYEKINKPKIQTVVLPALEISRDYLLTLAGLKQLYSVCKKNEVIFLHSPYFLLCNFAAIFARLLRKKIVCQLHGVISLKWRNFLHFKLINFLIDQWLILTPEDLEKIKKYVNKPKPHLFVENGVDQLIFHFRENKNISAINFLYVGRFEKSKGVLDLIHQLPNFPQLQFIFVGYGPLIKLLKKNPNAKVLPPQSHIDLSELMRENDVLIFPSHTESYPLVLIEALSCGLPVITTNLNQKIAEIVGSKGILIPVGDDNALANALKELSEKLIKIDPSEITKFSIKATIKKFYQII